MASIYSYMLHFCDKYDSEGAKTPDMPGMVHSARQRWQLDLSEIKLNKHVNIIYYWAH